MKFLRTVLEVPTEHQCVRRFPAFSFSVLLLFLDLPGEPRELLKLQCRPLTASESRSWTGGHSSTQLAGGDALITPTLAPWSLSASEVLVQGWPPALAVLAISYSGSPRHKLRANNMWAPKFWPCLPRSQGTAWKGRTVISDNA